MLYTFTGLLLTRLSKESDYSESYLTGQLDMRNKKTQRSSEWILGQIIPTSLPITKVLVSRLLKISSHPTLKSYRHTTETLALPYCKTKSTARRFRLTEINT